MDRDDLQSTQFEYVLAVASEQIGGHLTRDMQRHGVPLEYWRILSCLEHGEGKTMGELAHQALLSLPTATRVVDKMVAEALIYRAPEQHDRRKILVFRSDKGKALWSDIKADADGLRQKMVHMLGEEWMDDLVDRLSLLVDCSQKLEENRN